MSGYENSPDNGGPKPSWREAAVILVVVLAMVGTLTGAIWALRRLLVAWGIV
jgi:hypothetical protein